MERAQLGWKLLTLQEKEMIRELHSDPAKLQHATTGKQGDDKGLAMINYRNHW